MQNQLASHSLRSLLSRPFLIRTLLFSSFSSPSSPSNFLPSYLISKFNFSPAKAAKAGDLLPRRVSSAAQPDSVVSFFRSHGFSDSRLKKLFSALPHVLALSVDQTLAPRFKTFNELGFVGEDLITLVCCDPNVLSRNMENQVVPGIKLWRGLLGSHSLLMKCLTRSPWQIVSFNLLKTMKNVSILKECGLSDRQISMLVCAQPSIITHKPESLNELVSRVEKLGLPRGSPNFNWALYSLFKISEDNLRSKMEFFKGFGWTEEDFAKAFRKSPFFLNCSVNVLKEKMDFLLREARCDSCYVALHPIFFTFSLEKRLKPRVAVFKALKEKGLNGGDHKLSGPLCYTNKKFFEKYIEPHKEEFPELSELFSASSY